MTITKADGFVFFPKRCSKCKRLFWWEPYSKPYANQNNSNMMKLLNIEYPEVLQKIILCQECKEVET